MTKREARKEAYRQIVKQNSTHQEVFDELRGTSSLDVSALATVVAAIPSAEKREKYKSLTIVFVVVCSIVILLRVLGLVAMTAAMNVNMPIFLLALVLGLVVPAVAIFGALTWRMEMLQGSAGLFVLALIRSFSNVKEVSNDPIILVAVVPFLVAIILAFLIPYKVKTGFRETVITEEKDGKRISKKTVVFDQQEKIQSLDLLDS